MNYRDTERIAVQPGTIGWTDKKGINQIMVISQSRSDDLIAKGVTYILVANGKVEGYEYNGGNVTGKAGV